MDIMITVKIAMEPEAVMISKCFRNSCKTSGDNCGIGVVELGGLGPICFLVLLLGEK